MDFWSVAMLTSNSNALGRSRCFVDCLTWTMKKTCMWWWFIYIFNRWKCFLSFFLVGGTFTLIWFGKISFRWVCSFNEQCTKTTNYWWKSSNSHKPFWGWPCWPFQQNASCRESRDNWIEVDCSKQSPTSWSCRQDCFGEYVWVAIHEMEAFRCHQSAAFQSHWKARSNFG